MRKPKLAVGSEEDPGTEQDAGAASWRGAEDGFAGDVLADSIQLGRSEEAERWVKCVAGQVLAAPLSGALTVELCWSWPWQKSVISPSCLPCLAARSHCPLWRSVLGTAGGFLIHVQCNFSEDLNN